ncbi:putative transposase domain protein [Cyanobium sp. NS01]|nr:putative transposase domain protein [Cyanobium sp. NS01]
MAHRDSLVTILIPADVSGLSRARNNSFYRSTRLTPAINLIDTGQSRKVVAWDLAEVESAEIAADLVQRACLKER